MIDDGSVLHVKASETYGAILTVDGQHPIKRISQQTNKNIVQYFLIFSM